MFRVTAASIRRSSKTELARRCAVVLLLGLPACRAAPPRVVAVPSPVNAAVRLRSDIETILGDPLLGRSYWGIAVKSLRRGDTLYSRNAERLLMPGSTMKIVTLAVAGDRLGWDHTFDTRISAQGRIEAGVLRGDLVAVGSGDPSLTIVGGPQLFSQVAETLASLDVRAVSGRVIGDDDAFDDELLGPGWAWDDLAGRDAAGVSGLQYNENVVEMIVTPGGSIGAPAALAFHPSIGTPYLLNQVTTSAADEPLAITARRQFGNMTVVAGSIPVGSQPASRLISVANPTLFFAAALRAGIVNAGIDVHAAAVDIDDVPDAPSDGGALLLTHKSAPLSALAVRLMKNSQNLYADTLFKASGAQVGMPSFEGGRKAVAETLASWGVDPTGLVQVDGSGLSRYNYLTAETLIAVLAQMERDDRSRGPFRSSLPLAGQEGTLAGRMKGTAAEGNVRAKSGTLANVRSLAGYVTTGDGEDLAFAIIANNYGTMPDVAIAAIDAIVVKLAEFRR
jgi:D-alanyl-D-alanine carboxypeptidase/D-alanyl-D-alanine-endopeptidase (penicillin-binding protein 4)